MIEVFALEINFRAAKVFGHLFCEIEERRPICVSVQELVEFALKVGVRFVMRVRVIELDDSIHQRFGDVLSTVNAKSTCRVCHNSFLS